MPLVTISKAAAAAHQGLAVAFQPYEVAAPRDAPVMVGPEVPVGRTLDGLKDHPTARAYRELSWRLGIDPTKRRPAGEALARRLLAERPLPTIHPLVDAYNRASAAHLVPLSALDEDRIRGDIVLDQADEGEAFHGIGRDEEPLTGKELVMRDDDGVIAVFLYRDSRRTSIRPGSQRALVVACGAPSVQPGALKAALGRVDAEAGPIGWSTAGPIMVSTGLS